MNRYGLIQRRLCWLPTWRGWLLILLLFFGSLLVGTRFAYPFFAITDPVPADLLVVEGWAPPYAMEQAIAEFNRGHYRTLFVTGGVIEEGSLLSDYRTYADLGAAQLRRLGFPEESLQPVPAPSVRKDRTYQSACSLKAWMAEHGGVATSFNVISLGTHSRRTRLLFEMAFQSRPGIIAVPNRDFDPARWWQYSQGVRSVTDEMVAYLYARLVFRPGRREQCELSRQPQ